jgi:aryl-alcohol dehydrogenase-like predicted oxidoreductase
MSQVLQTKRPLGSSTLTVTSIALGCGSFGGIGSTPEFFGRGLNEDQAFELMDAAWELGITHFDTADAYGGGRSEMMIGRWIRSRGVRPSLTTKTYNPMQPGADHGLSPERIVRQLHSSLERLGVERIDLYLAHAFDPAVPLPETFASLEHVQAEGLIQSYGVSNFTASELLSALAAGRPEAIQNSYSLLAQSDATEVLPLCASRQVAYIAYSPLAGGWLAGQYRRGESFPPESRMAQTPDPYRHLVTDQTFDILDRLKRIAARRGTSLASLALSWLLAEERITQVVVGPDSPAHLKAVSEAFQHPLAMEERIAVEAVFRQ